MSRNRVNGVLFLLVLGLGTLVWLSDRGSQVTLPTPLTQLLPDQIGSIRISNQSGPAFSMKREGDRWRLTEPYPIEANETRIQRLLEIVATPVHTQFQIERNKLDEFELAPPVAVVHLDQLEIRVGGTDPINHYRYISISDRLYLIKDLFPHLLMAAAETYVSQKILPQGAELDLIQTAEWQLARTPDGPLVWQLKPAAAGISMDRLIEKVDEWKNAQALKVIKAPAVSPDNQVKVRLNGSDVPLSFGILRQQQETVLIREDLGLAYDLPRIDAMLSAPAGPTRVP